MVCGVMHHGNSAHDGVEGGGMAGNLPPHQPGEHYAISATTVSGHSIQADKYSPVTFCNLSLYGCDKHTYSGHPNGG